MVKITIKMDPEDGTFDKVSLESRETAYFVGIGRDAKGRHNVRNMLVGDGGVIVGPVVNALAESTAKLVISMADTAKGDILRYLLCYMEAFVDAVEKSLGAEALDKAEKMLHGVG